MSFPNPNLNISENEEVVEKEIEKRTSGATALELGSNQSLNMSIASSDGEITSGIRKKRTRDVEVDSESEEIPGFSKARAKRSTPVPKRGRGRPPTAGANARATKKLAEAKTTSMELLTQEEISDTTQKSRLERTSRSLESLVTLDSLPSSNMYDKVEKSISVITEVALKSRNLKGAFVKALNEAASNIREAMEALQYQSSTEEVRRLQADNKSLRDELAALRKEVHNMRAAMGKSASPSQEPMLPVQRTDDVVREVLSQVGTMINARFEAMEERLLPEKRHRPPLAADKRATDQAGVSSASNCALSPLERPWSTVVRSKGKKSTPAPTTSCANPIGTSAPAISKRLTQTSKSSHRNAPDSQSATANEVSVSATESSRKNSKNKKRQAKQKLRAPKTAAVVLTLQPDAVEEGITYRDILAKARQRLDLAALDIPAGLTIRQAVTGARVLELPSGVSSEAADHFAVKLREVLGGEARVTRPIKCADLRLTGLDDSISKNEVLSAVATTTGCPPEYIKGGEIRFGSRGTGSLWVQCPISAAQTLAATGHLQVGWSKVRIVTLEQRPLKCFRCMEIGHTRYQCSSEVDRTNLCYRCSEPGHKAATCAAKPHCAVCALVGKPADHTLGGKGCSPPGNRNKVGRIRASQKADRETVRSEETNISHING